ncbi:transcription initiation factor TFIID subunit 4b-like isoform X2 [Apium graveolens]|uniref:transcription initiation factor TFIID subunit 4b-like isoform X2 n=1 Tax=Apium graveolens TaxID=4045 RepID=UPI003D7A02E0
MDPSIMKLFEEDEDETMHSGADVEALTAALNRDIEGDKSVSNAALSQGNNHNLGQLPLWQTPNHDENVNCQNQQDVNVTQHQELNSAVKALNKHASSSENQLLQTDSSKELSSVPLQQKQPQDKFLQRQQQNSNVIVQEQNRTQDPSTLSQYLRSQKMNTHQTGTTTQANNASKNGKQVPFAMLFPVIEPLLDKDKAMQLRTIYSRLKQNEISKDAFVKHMRGLVGDHMLKLAIVRLQEQDHRSSSVPPNQFASHSQVPAQQQQIKMPAVAAKSHSFVQLNQKGLNSPVDPSGPSSAAQTFSDSSNMAMDSNAHVLRDIKQERERPFPIQGLNKQQQHIQFPPSFPPYGTTGSNYHQYGGGNIHSSAQSLKQQSQNMQARHVTARPGAGTVQSMGLPKYEKQNSVTEPMRLQGGKFSHSANLSKVLQNSVHRQSSLNQEQSNNGLISGHYVKQEQTDQANEQQKPRLSSSQGISSAQFEQGNASRNLGDTSITMQQSRMGFSTSTDIIPCNGSISSSRTQLDSSSSLSSATPSVGPGNIAKTPMKRANIGLEKTSESPGVEPLQQNKKQKVSHSDQSIEQLNDVTAVSGVNLREEEEQLFSGPKEDSRVSEASRRVVQEEEEKLIFQIFPLQKKMAEIMRKWGLKNIGNDVERCLSLSLEERLRALISNLLRLSKQRADMEKPRHRTIVTSDVRQQIIAINRKAREEWNKKQGDSEKSQGVIDTEGNTRVEGDKEKDYTHARPLKANKEDDDKMRTTAANVAARAAVGGDDKMSKWQLMAEARQKRGGVDSALSSYPGKEVNRKLVSTPVKTARDKQDSEKRSRATTLATSGVIRKYGKTQAMSQPGVPHNISVKDVIAVLEREPQTSKSMLIHRLYEKVHTDAICN